jgi:hypothetical protein
MELRKTYIRGAFSTFMAGRRVKTLMTKHETAQLRLRSG